MTAIVGEDSRASHSSGAATPRKYVVALACGHKLYFAVAQHVPPEGFAMPCPRHGFCPASTSDLAPSITPGRNRRAARTRYELVNFLNVARLGRITFSQLFKERFSCRMIREAEEAGHLTVDWAQGVVFAQPLACEQDGVASEVLRPGPGDDMSSARRTHPRQGTVMP